MNDISFLIQCNEEKPTEAPPALVSEYVHNKRIIPPGEPRAGVLDVHYMPHLIEPMDCMGPYSPVQIVSILKSVQAGVTFNCAENVIAYRMDALPSQILYASATDALLEKWTKRLEPLIDSCGFRHKIAAQVENTKSRKTGDKMYSKEYPGGSLSMTSLQSPAGLRSESKQILIIDEIDGAPARLTTGEGSALETLYGRVSAYGSRSKIMEFSTPTTEENSVIYRRYLAGDQRKYYVPCIHCGVYQTLEFQHLRPEYDETGALDKAWYECPHCKERIENHHKTAMLAEGEWRPTEKPQKKHHRSYHVTAMYNPVGMFDWKAIYQKYLESEEDPINLKPAFTQLRLGLPYKEDSYRPDIKKVIGNRGSYPEREVQDGVIYLTLAGDVQRGAEKYQKMSPAELDAEIVRLKKAGKNLERFKIPRIELEVYGIGKDYRSWSIDYKVFYGHTTLGAYQGAFERLYQWEAEEKGLTYKDRHGRTFRPVIAGFDASDGMTQGAVFDFCERFGASTYPLVNYGWLKKKKDPNVDEEDRNNFDRYRIATKSRQEKPYIQISTNFYKKQVYARLNMQRDSFGTPPGFCEFPRDRKDYYFDMLTAEEMRPDGSFYNSGRNAEALDCRGYNLCLADVWLDDQVRQAREKLRKQGYPESEQKKLDKKYVLNYFAGELEKQKK